MSGDSLSEILELVRSELELDERRARRLEDLLRERFGARRLYVSRSPKRALLEQLGQLPEEMGPEEKARQLGISVRRLYQLQSLLRG